MAWACSSSTGHAIGSTCRPQLSIPRHAIGEQVLIPLFTVMIRIRAFGEIGLMPKFNSANGELSGTYRFGTWYQPYPKQVFRDTLDGALAEKYRSGDMGFYFGFDQLVWKENSDIKDKQGISVFGRYGYAHGDVNRIEHFWSVGGQYVGLDPRPGQGRAGIGNGPVDSV